MHRPCARAAVNPWFIGDWYWSGDCTYNHVGASSGACLQPTFSDPLGLTGHCPGQDENGGHLGLGGWDSAVSGADWLHTNHANGNWYIRKDSCYAGGGGQGNSCNADTTHCVTPLPRSRGLWAAPPLGHA